MFKPLTEKKTIFMTLLQAGCIGHCVFEYVADLVTVSIFYIKIFHCETVLR